MMTDVRSSLTSLRVFLDMLQQNNTRFEEFLVNLTSSSGDVSTFTAFLNEQRPDLMHLQCVQQAIVRREIVHASLTFRGAPSQVHAYPAETTIGQHLHFARSRIGEVNIRSQTVNLTG